MSSASAPPAAGAALAAQLDDRARGVLGDDRVARVGERPEDERRVEAG